MSLLGWLDNLLHGNPAEFKFAVGLVSDCGLVRKDNQDCLLALPDAWVDVRTRVSQTAEA